MSEIQNSSSFEAQLDQLKVITVTDGEVWSARDLMPFAGYSRWESWRNAIGRAMISVDASGLHQGDHFRQAAKMVRTGSGAGRQIEDLELTRYACYILFQNADASKPEVAAAQLYFATQTRKQEVATVAMSEDEIIARALTIATGRVNALEAKVTELEPRAAQADMFRGAEGLRAIGDLANDLKVHAAANHPGVKVLQQDVFDLAGRVGLIIRGNTVRHNQPTAQAIKAGWVRPHESTVERSMGPQVKVSARLTPRGYGRLWDAAVRNLTAWGAVLPPLPGELTA